MSASSLAENANLAILQQRFQAALVYLKAVPVNVWRNGLYVFAALWICHSLAALVWVVIGEPDIPIPSILAAPAQVNSSAQSKPIDLQGLQELKMFGDGSAVAAPVEVVEQKETDVGDNAKTTKLSLKLQGTMVSNEPKHSGAIIESSSEQVYYRVGDELEKNRGVKLVKVFDEKVIIDNKGSIEALWLYSEEDYKKTTSRVTTPQVPAQAAPANATKAKVRPDQIPKSVGDVVRFSVHREQGRMVGYKIRPGRDRELFEQLGLKTNDIVISVNGIDVDDPKKIRSVYKEVKNAPEAELTIMRDGQTFTINVSIDAS